LRPVCVTQSVASQKKNYSFVSVNGLDIFFKALPRWIFSLWNEFIGTINADHLACRFTKNWFECRFAVFDT